MERRVANGCQRAVWRHRRYHRRARRGTCDGRRPAGDGIRRNALIVAGGLVLPEEAVARVADAALMLFLPQAAAIDGQALLVS